MNNRRLIDRLRFALIVAAGTYATQARAGGDDPFADDMVSYEPGVGGSAAYTIPETALGEPTRVSGKCFSSNDVVTVFSSPYCPDEIVSIGEGGHLIVRFDTPVTDDPNNLYGIDLLIFGNASFIDADWPNGLCSGVFNEGGEIAVSINGTTWHTIAGLEADGLWPTAGYSDVPAYTQTPGSQPTDFTRPVDPALTLADVLGMDNPQIMNVYRGSGGGTGIDLASVGLAEISYVRITVPTGAGISPEIDGFADVSPRQPGDVDFDGDVDVADLLAVIAAWGPNVPGGVPADFNNDGVINVADLLTVISNWGAA